MFCIYFLLRCICTEILATFDARVCQLDNTKYSNVLELWYQPNHKDKDPAKRTGTRIADTNHGRFRGEGITIAILDHGFDVRHPALEERVITDKCRSFNGEDQSDLSDPVDLDLALKGHGTQCAAIAAGRSYNGFQGGVACDARLILCKARTYSQYVEALKYINELCESDNNQPTVDVVSMSGGFYKDNGLKKWIDKLAKMGVIFVAATGNEGDDPNKYVAYPAKYDNVIAVGSHAHNWKLSTFAPNIPEDAKPIFTSLGENIYNINTAGDNAVEGTSFSTPAVADLIACILQAEINLHNLRPKKRWEKVLSILKEKMLKKHQKVNARALHPSTCTSCKASNPRTCTCRYFEELPIQ